MKTLTLAITALIIAAPLAAQDPTPPAPRARGEMRAQMAERERPERPTLTAEQRTQLRTIQDRHRDALRAIDDQRMSAQRKLEDETRRVVGEEQFRLLQRRGGDRRAANGERRAPQMPRRGPAAPMPRPR